MVVRYPLYLTHSGCGFSLQKPEILKGFMRTNMAFHRYSLQPIIDHPLVTHTHIYIYIYIFIISIPSLVIHWFNIQKTLGFSQEIVKMGKVKYVGLSEFSPEWTKALHAIHPVTAMQIEWSLVTRCLA